MTMPVVTDHALLRWLERVEGIDIESLRRQIAASAAIGIAFGAGCVLIGRGKLVIRNNTVVTTLPRHRERKDTIGVIQASVDGDVIVHRKLRRGRPR